MELLVLIGLILLNGLFAMSEIALVTARRARLSKLAADGDRAAAVAVELGEHPTRFLSTIQIGITAIGVLNGIIGEAAFSDDLAAWLQSLGVKAETARIGATALVVLVITYFTIVVGELVPKRLGQLNPEPIARGVARPMMGLAAISRPFVKLLTFSTESLLKLFPKSAGRAETVTEEEIHAMLEEGSEAGVIERSEHAMVRNVFRLDDRQLGSLMIPRGDIVFLDVEEPLGENLQRIRETQYSRFPVCRGGMDDILGVLSMRGLARQALSGEPLDLARNLEPVVYVPETLTGMELLEQFRASGANMVLVIDEYGEIQGLVTLQDVFETVIGEFRPQHADQAWAVQREDGSWLLDGLIPIPELSDRLGLTASETPDEERAGFQTLSGLVMWLLGRVPSTGDVATWHGWRLEVVDMDGKRIDKILASRIVAPPAASDEASP
jgi:putative hemolysin